MTEPTDKGPRRRAEVPYLHLNRDDEDDLRWYFRRGGLALFGASSMAGQLRRIELYSAVTEPCEVCGGDRDTGKPGTGFICSNRREARRVSELQRMQLEWLGIDLDAELPPLADRVCPTCEGKGWQVRACPTKATGEITANPTKSSVKTGAPGVNVGDVDMTRLGMVAARLARVYDVAPPAVDVLEAYYGDDGGQLLPIYPMTPAGKKLLKRASKDLDPIRALDVELIAEQHQSDPNRRALLNAAQTQAEALYVEACRIWNEAVNAESAARRVVANERAVAAGRRQIVEVLR